MDPVRIVLADDHEMMRQGIRALLRGESDLEVVGEAGDGLTALEMVERLTPDVLVADLTMPGLGGIELTHQAIRRSARTRVVILTMHAAEAFVLAALEQGASAYVLKDAGIVELVRAIRETASGRRYEPAALRQGRGGLRSDGHRGDGPRRPLRAAHAPGAPGPAPGRRRAAQHRHRREARDQRPHGRDPPLACVGQARAAEPDRACPMGPPPRCRHARRRRRPPGKMRPTAPSKRIAGFPSGNCVLLRRSEVTPDA